MPITSDSIQVHLNSKNAQMYGNTFSDCEFALPLIAVPSQHYIYLSVVHAVLPYSFYNVNAYNCTLSYYQVISGANVGIAVTIPYGNYNAIQLANYLQTQLPNMTITYNSITNKMTFTNSLYNFYFNINYSTCLELLGVPNTQQNYATSVLQSLTGYHTVNMSTNKCVCITTDLCTNSVNTCQMNNFGVLVSVPLTTSMPNGLIGYMNSTGHRFNTYTDSMTNIRIRLTDEDGDLLDLNGQYFSLTIQIDAVKFGDE